MSKLITLPCYGIVVEVEGKGGRITSCLHDKNDERDNDEYNAGMDAIESLILAHACSGVDIESRTYIEGIHTAVEACANNL